MQSVVLYSRGKCMPTNDNEDFKVSNGCFDQWKCRHRVSFDAASGGTPCTSDFTGPWEETALPILLANLALWSTCNECKCGLPSIIIIIFFFFFFFLFNIPSFLLLGLDVIWVASTVFYPQPYLLRCWTSSCLLPLLYSKSSLTYLLAF